VWMCCKGVQLELQGMQGRHTTHHTPPQLQTSGLVWGAERLHGPGVLSHVLVFPHTHALPL
jgi:hypothetical protein